MQISRENLNPCTVQLSIVCSPEEVQAGFDKAFKTMSKKMKLPGFRPGHTPRAMIEQYIDLGAWHEEAAEVIVRNAMVEAIKQENLEVFSQARPHVDLQKLNKDEKSCEFTLKVPLPPVVELGELKGLSIEQPDVDVTEDEIQYQIEEIRKQRSTREVVTDRGVQEGDVAVVNIKVDGDKGEGKRFMTMVGQTFPQLDQALMGMKIEESKTLDLTFPESFQDKDWAGKLLKAHVTLSSLNAVKLPEIDDEFAKSLQTQSVQDLNERVRTSLVSAKENMVQEMMAEQVMERLLERSKVDVPDNMWEALAERRLAETEQEQQEAGKTLEQYAQENGMSLDELKESWRTSAQLHVKRALMIREIFANEAMQIEIPDLNNELVRMSMEFGTDPNQMLEMLKKNHATEELHFRAISRKVTSFLIDNAEKSAVGGAKKSASKKAASEEEAPKKKPAAKKKEPATKS